jgi:hypothetical protein
MGAITSFLEVVFCSWHSSKEPYLSDSLPWGLLIWAPLATKTKKGDKQNLFLVFTEHAI